MCISCPIEGLLCDSDEVPAVSGQSRISSASIMTGMPGVTGVSTTIIAAAISNLLKIAESDVTAGSCFNEYECQEGYRQRRTAHGHA